MISMQTPDQPDTPDLNTPNLYPWAPHLAGMTHEEVEAFDTICRHEIAHGVMRWLLGHEATEIWASSGDALAAHTSHNKAAKS